MPGIRQLDQFGFHHTLEASAGPALVFFTGPACGACKRLRRVLEEAAPLFADIALFEVDAERDMGLVREFEVFHLPAMFLFRDGRFHCELHSEPTPPRLREAIDAALAAPSQEAP